MYKIRKIIVGLDLTAMDETLIKYASFVARSSSAEEIRFVNVIKEIQVPSQVLKDFPDLISNALEEREKQLHQEVEKYFEPVDGVKTMVRVVKGYPTKKLLKEAHEKSADLIIVGRKKELPGSGVKTHRIARRASCSVLFVPEGFQAEKLQRILVPSDFSKNSRHALEQAIDIAQKNETTDHKIEIVCQNVYTVPVGYHYTGKSFEEFAQIMEKNAAKDYKKFIKKIDFNGIQVKPEYSLDDNDDPVEDIHMKAAETKADLIVIGAKGQTATVAIFIGSMAERLIKHDFNQPLLMVRPKGKNAGFLDYLMEL
jgi:nucleotide-binding universal stress UspA family protein